jgi:predicted porin
VQTGLLPSALGIGAKTRQNDLDVAFQFTFFTGVDSGSTLSSVYPGLNGVLSNGAGGANTLNIRQAYLTFGDKSWGEIKLGRDLGVFGSDAILSDMTLLGVGNNAGSGGNSTLGRIGAGYQYADWVGQVRYTSPNFNGFQASAAIREPWSNGIGLNTGLTSVAGLGSGGASNTAVRSEMGYEGKVTYDLAMNDVNGRVWLGGIFQKHSKDSGATTEYDSKGIDVGAKLAFAGAEIVGYYYDGEGLSGSQSAGTNGLMFLSGNKSDDNGGYVQATYKLPTNTKVGLSWGGSYSTAAGSTNEFSNESWVVGAYHPLTKHLNLVAEYNHQELQNDTKSVDGKAKTVSLGAILFF